MRGSGPHTTVRTTESLAAGRCRIAKEWGLDSKGSRTKGTRELVTGAGAACCSGKEARFAQRVIASRAAVWGIGAPSARAARQRATRGAVPPFEGDESEVQRAWLRRGARAACPPPAHQQPRRRAQLARTFVPALRRAHEQSVLSPWARSLAAPLSLSLCSLEARISRFRRFVQGLWRFRACPTKGRSTPFAVTPGRPNAGAAGGETTSLLRAHFGRRLRASVCMPIFPSAGRNTSCDCVGRARSCTAPGPSTADSPTCRLSPGPGLLSPQDQPRDTFPSLSGQGSSRQLRFGTSTAAGVAVT